jgi:6,7-dimethyl-8-ribityllumazine synthase
MEVTKGEFSGSGRRIALVVAQFNGPITERLQKGAVETLLRYGVQEEAIECFSVPGAFELPVVCKECALTGKYDAVIAIGAVIRGETYHFEIVANQAASGVMEASLSTGVPVVFSVLTTDTVEQAWARSGVKGENHGAKGALTALEMASLMQKVKQSELCV